MNNPFYIVRNPTISTAVLKGLACTVDGLVQIFSLGFVGSSLEMLVIRKEIMREYNIRNDEKFPLCDSAEIKFPK